MTHRRAVLTLAFFACSAAFAGELFAASAGTTLLDRAAERRREREAVKWRVTHGAQNRPAGSPCTEDAQCANTCAQGVCTRASPVVAPEAATPSCQDDEGCGEGRVCRRFQCVPAPVAPPPSPPESRRLSPSEEQVFEVLLRSHATQLREELALGRGPLLRRLAEHAVWDPQALGVAVRRHRAALIPLVGDDGRASWPRDLLAQLNALITAVASSD